MVSNHLLTSFILFFSKSRVATESLGPDKSVLNEQIFNSELMSRLGISALVDLIGVALVS